MFKKEKNQGRPINEIDLHGLFVAEARQKVEEAIQRCQNSKQTHLIIIVGRGLHSPGKFWWIDTINNHNL